MPPAAAASQHSTSPQVVRGGQRDDRLGLGSQNEPFQGGVQVDLVHAPNFCVKKASNLYVSSAKSARARNSETEGVLHDSYAVPTELPRKLGADRAPGRRFGFRANPQKHSRI